jgi:hypothetical protein
LFGKTTRQYKSLNTVNPTLIPKENNYESKQRTDQYRKDHL